jgi:N-acylneuraminate cytidylyltransferase
MRIIAIIPARGGSKGIPRKNLCLIGEYPLVGLKIEQAKASMCTEYWVSTDDNEIELVSKSFGAGIIRRPPELSTDESSTDDMLIHAIDTLRADDDDIIVLLQPTAPLIKLSTINGCIEEITASLATGSVITIRDGHPFMWKSDSENLWNPDGHSRDLRPRRQDLGAGGWETGGCYAIRVHAFRKQRVRYPFPTLAFKVSYTEAIDVDTPADLIAANEIFDPKFILKP